MSLKQSLRSIQSRSRKKKAKEVVSKKEVKRKSEEKRVKLLRKKADTEFPKYVELLKAKAREDCDADELTVSIFYHDCQPFAQRLAELFQEEGMNCKYRSSHCNDYYGGETTFYYLDFILGKKQ